MKEYYVYLDTRRLPLAVEALSHAEMIAGALLHICEVSQIWDEPHHERRIYTTKEIPQDVPQAGIYWIQVNMPTVTVKKIENNKLRYQYDHSYFKKSPFFELRNGI